MPKTLKQAREDAERRAVVDTLRRTNGNVSMAARELGLTNRALWYALVRLEIKLSAFRPVGGGQ